MKKLSNSMWILVIVCVVASVAVLSVAVSAQPEIGYESSTVGRIVGETPEEMARQLAPKNLELGQSTYYSEDVPCPGCKNESETAANLLASKFPGSSEFQLGYLNPKNVDASKWWSSISESISDWDENPFFMLQAEGVVRNNQVEANAPLRAPFVEGVSKNPSDLSGWRSQMKVHETLFFFDTEYAGIHLPRINSFVQKFSPDATMISSTGPTSGEFTKIFVCNLGSYDTLSQTYRNARNNYYWNTNKPSAISLMSYELYGNPASSISVPNNGDSAVSLYCEDYINNYDTIYAESVSIQKASSASVQAVEPEQYAQSYIFTIDDYEVKEAGDYSFITADKTELLFEYDRLVLPVTVNRIEFPLQTVVNDVSLTGLSDPVDLDVDNLPSWEGELVNRTCLTSSREAGISFSHSYTEDKELIMVNINPVEIIDCENGIFRLYRKITYEARYIPYSPVLIEETKHAEYAFPGQEIRLDVALKSILTGEVSGSLRVSDSGGNIVAEKETSSDGNHTLAFYGPEEEGTHHYRLEFIYNGESVTQTSFSIRVSALDASLDLPVSVRSGEPFRLLLNNKLQEQVEVRVDDYLIRKNNVVKEGTNTLSLSPGENQLELQYDALDNEDQYYDLAINLRYGNRQDTLTGILTTNNRPAIYFIPDIVIHENDTLDLNPEINDFDGDPLNIEFSYPLDENGKWTPGFDDAGEYEATVYANDGLLEDSRSFRITVLNTDRAPEIKSISGVHSVRETQVVGISIAAEDQDGDELRYSIDDARFEQDGSFFSWATGHDDAGSYAFTVTVSDGEKETSQQVLIEVENVNRPPVIVMVLVDPPGGEMPANTEKTFTVLAEDPDGDELAYDWLLDSELVSTEDFFTYSPSEDDVGTHELSVEVTDGELSASQTIIITVLPPPCNLGDANFDGEITDADTVLILNYIVGNVVFNETQKFRADVNADSEIDVRDGILMKKFTEGKISRFPGC